MGEVANSALLDLLVRVENSQGLDARGTYWTRQDPRLAIPRDRWFEIQSQDVGQLCARSVGEAYNPFKNIRGCVERTANMDGEPILKIFYPPDPPQWLRDHEERHGDGWAHKAK